MSRYDGGKKKCEGCEEVRFLSFFFNYTSGEEEEFCKVCRGILKENRNRDSMDAVIHQENVEHFGEKRMKMGLIGAIPWKMVDSSPLRV